MSILMVARVDESKDHQTLLKAFASLGPSVELWLCGKGTDEGDFVDVALSLMKGEASGEIRFYGERTDVPALLAACDVFTLVSNFEALPLSIIEAMRAGKPVVATDIGGISELVVPGETGILVEPGDSDGLRRAFSELFDQRVRSQLGAKGRDRYLSNFGLEQMLAGLRRVYGAAARRAPIASSILDS